MRLVYPTDSQISQSRDVDQTIAAIGSEFKARVIAKLNNSAVLRAAERTTRSPGARLTAAS